MDTSLISVVVADDHAEMLKVVCEVLAEHVRVVASVTDGNQLVKAAVDLKPDVIVSDIEMPERDGLDAMLRLRSLGLKTPFVLLGSETRDVECFLDLGAAAYVHKYDVCADLVESVRLAALGRKFVSRSIGRK